VYIRNPSFVYLYSIFGVFVFHLMCTMYSVLCLLVFCIFGVLVLSFSAFLSSIFFAVLLLVPK
jgi:hypothetical protein